MAMGLCKPNLLLKLFFIVSLLLLLAAATPTEEEEEEKRGNWGPTEGEERKRQLSFLGLGAQLGKFMKRGLPASKAMDDFLSEARNTFANQITKAENTGKTPQEIRKWNEFKEGISAGEITHEMIERLQNVTDTYCNNHSRQCCVENSTTTLTGGSECANASAICQITDLVYGNDCNDIPLSSQPQIQALDCTAWQQANNNIIDKYKSCLSKISSESTQDNSPGLTVAAAAAAYCLYNSVLHLLLLLLLIAYII